LSFPHVLSVQAKTFAMAHESKDKGKEKQEQQQERRKWWGTGFAAAFGQDAGSAYLASTNIDDMKPLGDR